MTGDLPQRDQLPSGSGTLTAWRSACARFLRAALALGITAALILALPYLWRHWQDAMNRQRPAATPSIPAAETSQETPMVAAAKLLGVSPELPQTAEGLNAEAFETCERLLRDLPQRSEAQAVAAFLFNRHGRSSEAAKCWERALELNRDFGPAYLGLGIVSADKGEYDKAKQLLEKAVELDPGAGYAHSLLTDVLLRRESRRKRCGRARVRQTLPQIRRQPLLAGPSVSGLGPARRGEEVP